MMNKVEVLRLINEEHERATAHFRPFNSYHEGSSVIREEFEELWDQIKKKDSDPDKIREEAVQLGAMVVRFLHELC